MSHNVSNQILITGCYRTGSEFLTQLVNNHPKISATFYTVNFMRFCYGQYDPIEKEENWKVLITDALEKLKLRYGRELSVDDIVKFLPKKSVSYADLYQALILAQHAYDGMTLWAEKTQLVWTKIPAFLNMYPNGKAIHIIRDPRSVLASFKYYTNAEPPRYLGAIFNCLGSMKQAMRLSDAVSDDKYRCVRYEDLLLDPQKTMKSLFDFLGVDATHDILSTEGWKDSHGQPWIANTSFDMPDRPNTFQAEKALKRWKGKLDIEEQYLCEMVCGLEMDHFGYETDAQASAIPFSAFMKSCLSDEQIAAFFQRWINTGEGVEQFPTDPLDKSNWDDVKIQQELNATKKA